MENQCGELLEGHAECVKSYFCLRSQWEKEQIFYLVSVNTNRNRSRQFGKSVCAGIQPFIVSGQFYVEGSFPVFAPVFVFLHVCFWIFGFVRRHPHLPRPVSLCLHCCEKLHLGPPVPQVHMSTIRGVPLPRLMKT